MYLFVVRTCQILLMINNENVSTCWSVVCCFILLCCLLIRNVYTYVRKVGLDVCAIHAKTILIEIVNTFKFAFQMTLSSLSTINLIKLIKKTVCYFMPLKCCLQWTIFFVLFFLTDLSCPIPEIRTKQIFLKKCP